MIVLSLTTFSSYSFYISCNLLPSVLLISVFDNDSLIESSSTIFSLKFNPKSN